MIETKVTVDSEESLTQDQLIVATETELRNRYGDVVLLSIKHVDRTLAADHQHMYPVNRYVVRCEYQQRESVMPPGKIKGYRTLTQQEIDRANAIKEMERRFLKEMETLDLAPETDKRHTALARTKMEEASMWAVKAITRPEN